MWPVFAAWMALCPGPASAETWRVLGESPATGHGVFRFPQALAYSPGGGRIFVGDQFSAVVQRFSRDGTWEADVGWYADDRELGRIGVLGGLGTDRDGHLYVLDSENDRVQVFDGDSGRWLAAWGSRGSGAGEFALGRNTGAGGIAVDQAAPGAPVVVYIADQNNHRIQRFTLDASTAAGDKVLPPGERDAERADVVPVPRPDALWGRFGSCAATGCAAEDDRLVLDHPQGIAVDPRTQNVFVADDRNHRVVEYRADGSYVRQLGSYGRGAGQFRFPYDVGIDAAEGRQLYVADNNNHRVQAFDAVTLAFTRAWGAFGPEPGRFEYPRALGAVADDPAGGVAVADTANNRAQVFSREGALVAQWGIAGRGPGYVTRPGGVAVDAQGRVHVADTLASRIQRLAPDGAYIGQTGYISARSGFAAPAAGPGQFDIPHGVAADHLSGRLWIADTHNDRVQELTADGEWVATHAGLGFRRPLDVAVTPDGAVLVADTGNHRVQRRDPRTGAWSEVDADTPVSRPAGVAGDASGAVYVSEPGTDRVLRIAGGRVEALPGAFHEPTGLALHDGQLYVADTGAGRVLRQDVDSGGREILGGEGRDLGSFVAPGGVAVHPAGDFLVVADTGNDRLQTLQLRGSAPATTRRLAVTTHGKGVVRSTPAGIDCATDCRQSFSPGATVTLEAVASGGAVFTGWEGACSGTGPCQVQMTADAEVRASFVAAAAPPPLPPPPPPSSGPSPATAQPDPSGPARPAEADRRAPRVTVGRVPARVRPARRGPLVSPRPGRGGELRVRLSEAAEVSFRIRGRRGRQQLSLPRGVSRLWLSGRVGGRALPNGRHVLLVRATDAAGNRSPDLRIILRVR